MPASTAASKILMTTLIMAAGHSGVLFAADSDGDGIRDNLDNCLAVFNTEQRDTDNDGIGNACDADLNNDCVVNDSDLDILRKVFFSSDANADFNGDGMVNAIDLGALKLQFSDMPGLTGAPNLCTCAPPTAVPQQSPNFEFNGQEMFLLGGFSENGMAVSGINNFSDQDNGLYLARIFAQAGGTFDYRVVDQASTIEYCSDSTLAAYAPLEVPFFGCEEPPGSLQIPAPGCYQVAMRTDGSVLPADVELTLGERLGHWDIEVDVGGGIFSLPNGIELNIPPGAVNDPVTLTMGDIPCAQVDALFGATSLKSHDNRCIGAFSGEPDGFKFNTPVSVSMPAGVLLPGEIPLWITSSASNQDYTLIPTAAIYNGELATVEATLDGFSIIVGAGAKKREIDGQSLSGLPPCFFADKTPKDSCCAGKIKITSDEGDSISSSCDLCQLLGFNLTVEFLDCGVVFHDSETHSSASCPNDLQTEIQPSNLTMWTCEDRDIEAKITGTKKDGSACSMLPPVNWTIADDSIASFQDKPPNMANITGVKGGTTSVNATSPLGTDFSSSMSVEIVDLAGAWEAWEEGEETCLVTSQGGSTNFTEEDFGHGTVQVSIPTCSEISFDVGIPGVAATGGDLVKTGESGTPFTFKLERITAPDTIGCVVFKESNGSQSDFGGPLCPTDANCWDPWCLESTTDNGKFFSANNTSQFDGSGTSSWDFDAGLTFTFPDDPEQTVFSLSATCNGTSESAFKRSE